MTLIFRLVAAIVFILLFVFALKNTHDAALMLFLGYEIRAPLVLIILGFFIVGAALGILAIAPTLFRYRRELARQRKSLTSLQADLDTRRAMQLQPPQPDVVASSAPALQ